MSFRKGDIVRIGKGKVEYTVEYGETVGMIHVQSHNTGKSQAVDPARLVLVEAVQDVAEEAGCSVEELAIPTPDLGQTGEDRMATFQGGPEEGLTGTVVSTVPERSAYSKAILAALQLKSHVFAGLKRPKVRTTTRARKMAKNARRQARKAAKR